MDLFKRSIEIILANQHPSGAYVASPNFPTYRYCWFRDASFVAYAMDLVGHPESAGRFHAWAARTVIVRAKVVRRALEKAAVGQPLGEKDILHTRLTLSGQDGTYEEWGNFQLDGFGTWLWALDQHRQLGGALPEGCQEASGLVAAYLAGLWRLPNYDCWEEHPAFVHPYTLGAIYGGLKAYSGISGEDFSGSLAEIRTYIEDHFVYEGHFVKFSGRAEVDASLLGLAVPYGVFPIDEPRMVATLAEIKKNLCSGHSGVRRYRADTYYGGGEWALLTAWLGWSYVELMRIKAEYKNLNKRVAGILSWIETQADAEGYLPEQVPHNLNAPSYYQTWVNRWGPIASPLLWSHAKYLILKHEVSK